MSTTYTIACTECKESYWCGQGNYLYQHVDPIDGKFWDTTMEFLQRHEIHKGCKLVFINDNIDSHKVDEISTYKKWKPDYE